MWTSAWRTVADIAVSGAVLDVVDTETEVRGQRIAPSGTKKAKEPPRFIVAEAVSAVRVARSEAVDPADLAWRTMPALAIDAFAGSSAQALREPCEGSVDMGLRGVGQGGAYVAAAAARVLVSTWAV